MSSTPENLGGGANIWNSGFWASLFSNAADIEDSLGRGLTSFNTSFGNNIMGWIQAGKGSYPTVTVEKEDNSLVIAIIVVCVAIVIGIALMFKN